MRKNLNCKRYFPLKNRENAKRYKQLEKKIQASIRYGLKNDNNSSLKQLIDVQPAGQPWKN